MRNSVKLWIVLPVLLCGVEGILWYWELHSRPTVRLYAGNVSPAVLISNGLDFPAASADLLVRSLWEAGSGQLMPTLPGRLLFMLSVAFTWSLVGHWLDNRAARERQQKPGELTPWVLACHLAPIAFGVFTLLFSFQVHSLYFAEVTERALLQTWAAFLIGVPALGVMRRTAQNSGTALRPRTHMGNFRGFMIALGLFAALLILGVVTSPGGLK